jgi:hypothetical protein
MEANTDISKASFNLNGSTVPAGNIKHVDEKKVLIFTDLKPLENAAVVVRNTVFSDTITTRLTERDKTKKLVPVLSGGKIGPHQALAFEVNDLVVSLDTALITLTDPDDSSKISLRSFELTQNNLSLDIDRDKHKRVEVSFKKGAIRTTTGMDHDEFKTTVDLLYEKDFGILHIDASGYSGSILLELLKEKTVVQTIALNETKLADIEHILPGEYQIRVITDADQNGKWSSGDLGKSIQPERVDWFTVPKIRANWEVDILLSPER